MFIQKNKLSVLNVFSVLYQRLEVIQNGNSVLKNGRCDANFFVTGGTGGCRYDNLQ